ncbi:unnamed protein product [Spirodela intermedia]|uniref:Nodulin-like domain-containing protein n=1 Tax=Spirodela intermedia TaxID=51605 RepID=A0A7I8JKW0_SPIIN|nr:unnamed protein product [Spirodela intermedia]CAA6670451.1 unnamed protein product [Spirodela intermedia]
MPAMAVKNGSRPPWVGLGAAVWVQMAAGCGYTFPLYSPALKSALGLTQQQLTILGVANGVGENIGVLPGVFCNRIPPWGILLVGAARHQPVSARSGSPSAAPSPPYPTGWMASYVCNNEMWLLSSASGDRLQHMLINLDLERERERERQGELRRPPLIQFLHSSFQFDQVLPIDASVDPRPNSRPR